MYFLDKPTSVTTEDLDLRQEERSIKERKPRGSLKKRNPKILWFHSLKTNYFLSSVGEKKILNSKIIGGLFWFTLYLADYSFSHQQEKASQTVRPEIMSFDCNWQKKHLRERKKILFIFDYTVMWFGDIIQLRTEARKAIIPAWGFDMM